MSMYHMITQPNPLTGLLLALAGLTIEQVDRFRDIYLRKGADGNVIVVVFARIGGGNRDAYAECIKTLRLQPQYIDDEDFPQDSTYAEFSFKILEKYQARMNEFYSIVETCPPMAEAKVKLSRAMDAMKGIPPTEYPYSDAPPDEQLTRAMHLNADVAFELGLITTDQHDEYHAKAATIEPDEQPASDVTQ